MTSRDRIIKYVEYKGISKNKFYKETGLSNGFLDKNTRPLRFPKTVIRLELRLLDTRGSDFKLFFNQNETFSH